MILRLIFLTYSHQPQLCPVKVEVILKLNNISLISFGFTGPINNTLKGIYAIAGTYNVLTL